MGDGLLVRYNFKYIYVRFGGYQQFHLGLQVYHIRDSLKVSPKNHSILTAHFEPWTGALRTITYGLVRADTDADNDGQPGCIFEYAQNR